MPAGNAVCDCDLPNSCVCKVDITSNIKKAPTYTYNQKGALPNIFGHDIYGHGADIQINVISKGCIGKHSDCPKGVIYDQTGRVYKTVIGKGTYPLKFMDNEVTDEFSTKYNIVLIIAQALEASVKRLPVTPYRFRVNECQGKPLMYASPSSAVQVGTYVVSDSEIKIYPNYKLTLKVSIGLESRVKKLTSDERREIMSESNQQSGRGDDHTGWTRRTGSQSIKSGITIEGSASVVCGDQTIKSQSDKIKKDFERYKNKFTLLDSAERALSTVGKLFSTTKKGGDYPIFRSEFAYPALAIEGGHELAFSEKTTQPYLRGYVSVGLSPLIGVKFTIDLIQAFAAYYGAASFTETLREAGAANEKNVKSGRNGAYFGALFDLIISGLINVKFSIKSDEQAQLSYQADERIEGKLSIAALLTIRAGAKIGFINGYFQAGGQLSAEGCFGLLTEKESLYLIFYHNGVQAEFWVEYGLGVIKEDRQDKPSIRRNDNGVVISRSSTQITTSAPFQGKNKRIWMIHDKLPKNKSIYRIKLNG
ncbi:hypothetical protein B7R74_21420 [Yersinia pseudotuberculosis]|uniref:Uncharacterized protein n=1 Tax=Yersinia pseudotuberculosis TaxID=633 RepID=A0A380QA02_YERPU|nr:hypothetical protein [Yersinia pseudotuberculosis]PSH11478.1 hypothetical protein B7R74_21420 [Yersinia pseudotuberculosis]SUP83978.1 Uncharacterised protein [Yersinia pseudotuberculosis]